MSNVIIIKWVILWILFYFHIKRGHPYKYSILQTLQQKKAEHGKRSRKSI